ncbi:ASCH domain-containing protein [Candidatus Woesearchaeota archaeon]|nr:ASCH domain-containing protein [Candidatus Woesearchaeota archaeon]
MKSKRGSIPKVLGCLQKKNSIKSARKANTPTLVKRLSNILQNQNSVTLYSVNPEYSKLIFSGEKKIELRKTLPKIKNKLIAIYETAPTKKVVGFCEISKYQELPLSSIGKFVKKAKINKNFLYKYYKGKSKFVAIEIKKTHNFKKPLTLNQFLNKEFKAPQSYSYIKDFSISSLPLSVLF